MHLEMQAAIDTLIEILLTPCAVSHSRSSHVAILQREACVCTVCGSSKV